MKKVLVVGDSVIDTFLYGKEYRKNPEGHAPLLKIDKREYFLGAASNVARNIKKLGSEVDLCSLIGNDPHGIILFDLLENAGIDHSLCWKRGETIEKIRVCNDNDYIVRADIEDDLGLSLEQQFEWSFQIASLIEERLDEYGVVVISDYAKGWVSDSLSIQIIDMCREKGIFVMADPKGVDIGKYYGANLITPNKDELFKLNHTDNLERGVENTLAYCENLLLTKGADGLTLFTDDGIEQHWPALAQGKVNCVGAGDLILAGTAHFLNTGKSLQEAIEETNNLMPEALKKSGTVSF